MAVSPYVLITAAYNEERFLPRTVESVFAQTVVPERWVIVSDASTDATDGIITSYAHSIRFIRYVRIAESHPRSLARRIAAIRTGYGELTDAKYEYIGNVDADVSFDPTYFEQLLDRFSASPRLGIAAGALRELKGTNLAPIRGEATRTVANAAQLFRRECFEEVGGYPELPYGAPDTYVEVAARMKGWRVQTFPELVVGHHRLTGTSSGVVRGRIRQGFKDRSFGYHPLFEIFKCARRMAETPLVIGGVARMAGYLWSCIRGDQPAVSADFVQFLRREQMARVRALVGWHPFNADDCRVRN